MRDVKRIKPFMDKLTKEWEKYPDLRFVQFVNLIFDNAEHDPFYYEEKDTLKLMELSSGMQKRYHHDPNI